MILWNLPRNLKQCVDNLHWNFRHCRVVVVLVLDCRFATNETPLVSRCWKSLPDLSRREAIPPPLVPSAAVEIAVTRLVALGLIAFDFRFDFQSQPSVGCCYCSNRCCRCWQGCCYVHRLTKTKNCWKGRRSRENLRPPCACAWRRHGSQCPGWSCCGYFFWIAQSSLVVDGSNDCCCSRKRRMNARIDLNSRCGFCDLVLAVTKREHCDCCCCCCFQKNLMVV